MALTPTSTMPFDDYQWRYAASSYMASTRDDFMTKSQIEEYQVKLLVDTLVKTHIGYEEVITNKGFKKIAHTARVPT